MFEQSYICHVGAVYIWLSGVSFAHSTSFRPRCWMLSCWHSYCIYLFHFKLTFSSCEYSKIGFCGFSLIFVLCNFFVSTWWVKPFSTDFYSLFSYGAINHCTRLAKGWLHANMFDPATFCMCLFKVRRCCCRWWVSIIFIYFA